MNSKDAVLAAAILAIGGVDAYMAYKYSKVPSAATTIIYTPITLHNAQSQSTPSNFQQLIQATTIQYPNGVRFWSPTDGYLPAWLESIQSNSANIWVKIPSSIPANGIYQLYMIQDSTLPMDGVYWGEAPQLSSTYGQYDNGASVFNNYNNFAGTTLPSNYSVSSNNQSDSTYSVNNGVFLEDYFLNSTFSYDSSHAIYGIMKFSAKGTVSAFNDRFGYVPDNNNYFNIGGSSSSNSAVLTNYDSSTGSGYDVNVPNFYNQTAFLGLWVNDTTTFGMINGNIYQNSNDFYNPSGSTSSITVQALYENATVEVYALMVGNAPPNGVMPTAYFGASQYSGTFAIVP